MHPPTPQTGATAPRDQGMTLIEVVVALGLFMVMATAALAVLGAAITVTRDDKARVEAVNLASRELEITRDTFESVTRGPEKVLANRVVNPSPLPGGRVGDPLVVNGVAYTVVRTAQWAAVGQAASACDDGTTSERAYLRVAVEVSWPELGGRPPVTMNTVMTPPKGTYSTLQGYLGLKVIDSDGEPSVGVAVTARSSAGVATSGNTSRDGCVLLAHLEPGTYTVTASQPGFVNLKGDPTAATTATVQTGRLWRGTIEYDQAASISATLGTAAGYALPTGGVPLTIANSGLQPTGVKVVTGTGNPRVVTNLWPYPSGYEVWAGGCQDADPGLTGVRDRPVPTERGTTVDTTVRLAPLEVHAPAGSTVRADHVADSLCTSAVQLTLGTTDASGVLRTSAPYGHWTVVVGGTGKEVVLAADPADPPLPAAAAPVVTFP